MLLQKSLSDASMAPNKKAQMGDIHKASEQWVLAYMDNKGVAAVADPEGADLGQDPVPVGEGLALDPAPEDVAPDLVLGQDADQDLA